MRIYVASSFLNKEGTRRIQYALKQAGHRITSDWTAHLPTTDHDRLKIECMTDMRGIIVADALVLLNPFRYSSSAELGIALGNGIPVYFLCECSDAELNDILTQKQIFLHHNLVTIVRSIDELVAGLAKYST